MNLANRPILILSALSASLHAAPLYASSHREAPLITEDPTADSTDLYAFISPDGPAPGMGATVTILSNWIPFEEPAGPPNGYRPSGTALYEIKIDNTGDAVEDIVYQFRFRTQVGNGATFLYNTGDIGAPTSMNLNVKQTYSVTRLDLVNGAVTNATVLGTDFLTAPSRIGPRSNATDYPTVAAAAVYTVGSGNTATKVFVGPRDEGFFVDINAIFDLLNISRSPLGAGPAVDGTAGFNVHTMAIQVPVRSLTAGGREPTDPQDHDAPIGVWTTASRRKVRVLRNNGSPRDTGPWIQVSRLGLPLINEVVVPLGFKDQYNRSAPADDLTNIAGFVTDPELSRLLASVHGLCVPPTPRNDLVSVISFLPGASGLTSRTDLVPADMLRLNVAIPATAQPNRLGVIAGDTGGFPNGRRVADDVVDILERVVGGGILASGTPPATGCGAPVTSWANLAPNNALADGVDQNDVPFLTAFPYLGTPHEGFVHHHAQ